MTAMSRNAMPTAWILVHFGPLLLVPLATHTLNPFVGIDNAAAVTHLLVLIWIAVAQWFVLRPILARPDRWIWRTAAGAAAAVIAGLVVMSTVDLRGYDALATIFGMGAAGLALGLVQAPGQPRSKSRWVLVSFIGWLGGALVFRSIIVALANLSLSGFLPYGLAYNAGHNELLWFAVGLACYGVATAWNIASITRSTSGELGALAAKA
ncbi:MAG TPA: hypothetical protein VM939_04315 [Gemmatimonadaceae bacterium]|nr:hypothetical protein [Gemmatimonadaceae bacterium]